MTSTKKIDNFLVMFSTSTVSSVLVHIPSYKVSNKFIVSPIMQADEVHDEFGLISDMLFDLSGKINAKCFLIEPAHVASLLKNADIEFCYDELSTEHLIIAINLLISEQGSSALGEHLESFIPTV